MKKKKIMKWISSLISGILMILLISVAAVVVITKASGGEPQLFGYQIKYSSVGVHGAGNPNRLAHHRKTGRR